MVGNVLNRYQKISGADIWYVNVAVCMENTNGEPIKMVRSAMDISADIKSATVKEVSMKNRDWMVRDIVMCRLSVNGN